VNAGPPVQHAVILAFDGVLFDTLPARTAALHEALAAEGMPIADEQVRDALPGRAMAEALQQLDPTPQDFTRHDLVLLRAQRLYAGIIAHGVPLVPEGLAALRDAVAAGHRVVLRSDSERRHVEPLLALSGLDTQVSLLRCADDPPRGAGSSFDRSWQHIDERLNRLGVAGAQRQVHELTARPPLPAVDP
jgi:beta-phosphoglucomutase-like phosphatase (HAD superfamily)